MTPKKFFIVVILSGILLSTLYFLLTSFTFAFNPPTGSGGSGGGAIGVDVANNLAIGTSTAGLDSRVLIYATSSNAFYLKVVSPTSSPMLVVTNSGRVGIATSTPTSTLTVQGDLTVTGVITGLLTGKLNAANVEGGVFGTCASCIGGNYSFPSGGRLGIATSTTVGLPQTLSVYGGAYVSSSVGIGTSAPQANLHVYNVAPTDTTVRFEGSGTYLKLKALTNYYSSLTFNSGAGAGTDRWEIGLSRTSGDFRIYDVPSVATRLAIDTSGRVGIGTSSPAYNLDVVGTLRAGTSTFGTATISPSTKRLIVDAGSSGNASFGEGIAVVGTGTAPPSVGFWASVFQRGAIGLALSNAQMSPNALTSDIVLASYQSNIRLSAQKAGGGEVNIIFETRQSGGTGPVERMRITPTGEVGINDPAPTYKLDIGTGDINVQTGVYRQGGTGGITRTCAVGEVIASITVSGGIITQGSCVSSGGASTVIAANVASGTFGANTGGGDYTFPANVGIGVSSTVALLNVQKDQDTVTQIAVQNQNTGLNAITQMTFFQNSGSGLLMYAPASYPLPLYADRLSLVGVNTSQGISLISEGATADIRFGTGLAVERMRIDASGNIGMGTQAPGNQLHLEREFPSIQIRSSSTNNRAGVFINHSVSGGQYEWFAGTPDGNAGKFMIGSFVTVSHNPTSSASSTNARLTIQNNGNVGIGTTAPTSILHLYGTTPILTIEDSGTGRPFLLYRRNGATVWDIAVNTQSLNDNNLYVREDASTIRMTIQDATGNVGMGTTNPQSPLHVKDPTGGASYHIPSVLIERSGVSGVSSPRLALVDTNVSPGAVTSSPAWVIDNLNDTFRIFRQPNINTAGSISISIASSSGNVGIVTAAGSDRLTVYGDIRVGTTGTNGCLKNYAGTALVGTCASDVRLKKNIQPLTSLLGKVVELTPVKYEWRKDEFPEFGFGSGINIGLVAQDVEKVLPELVSTDGKGYKTIHFQELQFYLLQAIKEQQATIEELKAKVYNLEEQIKPSH